MFLLFVNVIIIRFVVVGIGYFPCVIDVSGSYGRWVSLGFGISVVYVLVFMIACWGWGGFWP